MLLNMLRAKIHRATVTESNLNYEGSIGIDRDLIDAAGWLPYEQVDVLNVNNGERFTTYIIEEARGSKAISIRGAAARRAEKGDIVIICSYAQMTMEEAKAHKPVSVKVDGNNTVKK